AAGRPPTRSAATRRPGLELGQGAGVDHRTLWSPAAPGPFHPVLHPSQLGNVVAVGRDSEVDPSPDCATDDVCGGIEPIEGAVHLQGHAGGRQPLQDGVDVELDTGAPADVAAGEVTDGVD